MRDLQPLFSGLATIAIGIAAAFQPAPAPAQPIAPCAQIRAACEQAGFVQGAVRDGYGLQIDCVRPIMQETPQPPRASKPLPQINPELIAACREKNPNFGGPRASASDMYALPPSTGPAANPRSAAHAEAARYHPPSPLRPVHRPPWKDRPQQRSLNNFIGAREQRRRHLQAQRICDFAVDNERKLGRLLHRQIPWLRTPKDAINIRGRLPELLNEVEPIINQAAVANEIR